MSRKTGGSKPPGVRLAYAYILLGFIIIVLLLAIFYVYRAGPPGKLPGEKKKSGKSVSTLDNNKYPEKSTETSLPSSGKVNRGKVRGKLYFVLDDVGNNVFQLKPFLKLPFKITFAILPGLPYTEEAGRLINEAGKEYIIHQPMDAVGKQNPGPGALHIGMDESTIKGIVAKNLTILPLAKGMNNHMGSAATADRLFMINLFKVLKSRNMFFLDSRTTSKSMGREAAERVGIPFAERSVFLDNNQEKKAIQESVEKGLDIAEKKGHAIMIGHVWSSELAEVLLELYPALLEDNYTLNNLTELFMGYREDEDPWN